LNQYTMTEGDAPEVAVASINTYNLFELLGVEPWLGDTWPRSHDRAPVFEIVLSHRMWERRFGADRAIVGKSILLDGGPYTVLGVLPPGFLFPSGTDFFRRVPPGDYANRGIRSASVVARLRPGVTLEAAQAELDAIARRFAASYPESNRDLGYVAVPLRSYWIGSARPYLLLLQTGVLFVLLMTCANVVNLLLSDGLSRRREIALRAALGASRGRISRELLTESLLLAGAGGLAGVLLAIWGVGLLRNLTALDLPPWISVSIDWPVLLFSAIVSLAAGIVAGLLPARQASAPDLAGTLKEGARGSGGVALGRIRRGLVMSEVALAVLLLAGAFATVRGFLRLAEADVGFDPKSLLTVKIDPPGKKYNGAEVTVPFYRRLFEELSSVPGVESAAAGDGLPMANLDVREGANRQTFLVEGQSQSEREENPFVTVHGVSAGYFATLRIPVLEGRGFDDRDRLESVPVALVSKRLAEAVFPGGALGKRIQIGRRGSTFNPAFDGPIESEPWLTIAGVVGNVRSGGLASEAGLDVYLSDQQTFVPETYLVFRTAADPEALIEPIRRAVRRVDPDQPVFDVRTMERRVEATVWQQRLTALVFAAFGALAVLLAAVGTYGVMSRAVAQRSHEMGIRLAVGASGGDVLRLVLGEALYLAVAGGMVGIGGALLSFRFLGSRFAEAGSMELSTLVAIALGLGGLAVASSAVPALRASRLDPLSTLRAER
jgi:putative ABC transport system permease protein